ncbi:MAG: 23S rRNA (adenine(2503)-C(2))-methyltransferase RlmN [Planctomycetaceae bacterium]|nr:23S rRNA (adenine(2503)-C(2))-methyltransferase RlmN [Planctomycetaceae bacterium]
MGRFTMPSLLDAFPEDLTSWLAEQGQPSFRAQQIERWLFGGRVSNFSEMTDLPTSLREALPQRYTLFSSNVVHHQRAVDGTEKLLVEFGDRETVECVLLRDRERRTICISSQVGCAMGCVFCASGLDGVKRNLTSGEIIEQMLHLQRLLPKTERLSHIVVMGMGEPLANLDQLLPALQIAHTPTGLGISARRITISTVGLPAAMRRIAELAVPYHLAISLHAPNDDLRNQLVPVNSSIGLKNILDAAEEYFQASGRRLTFEYVLLGELNDRPHHAKQLAQCLRGKNALLNVIPYNPVAGLPYQTPRSEDVSRFCQLLTDAGISVQVRERKGDEINAACGQLRRERDTNVLSLDTTRP